MKDVLGTTMTDNIKDKVKEFASIAKDCPDNLQEKCFEILLSDHLAGVNAPARAPNVKPTPVTTYEEGESHGVSDEIEHQEDIQQADIHIKARKFLKKYSLSVDDLNQVFYKDGKAFLPLYEDLKTTRAAESQVRVGLLRALESALHTGEFEFNGEEVRDECQARKCYDGKNFSANFKNNASLFDKFSKYNKTLSVIRLSEDGRKELAELIKELK